MSPATILQKMQSRSSDRHVLQFLTGREPAQLGGDQPVGPREERGAGPADVRGDQHVRGTPERVVGRQRFRARSRRARPAAGPDPVSATSASVSTSLPRATLTSSAPSGSSASCRRRSAPRSPGWAGRSRSRRPPRAAASGSSSIACTRGSPCRARRATRVTEATSNPASRRSMAGPDVAVPDDQDSAVGQGAIPKRGAQEPSGWFRAKSSRCRPLASVSATASSAVLASCTPAALHR